MSVIDLTDIRAIVETDGKLRCIACIDGENYRNGCDPTDEILFSRNDIENTDKLYICDYCEKEL